MRYVLEIKGKDDSKTERVVSDDDRNIAFHEAGRDVGRGEISKATLWQEFDSMEEAPSDDGCGYRLVNRNDKRTLRRCSAATGW